MSLLFTHVCRSIEFQLALPMSSIKYWGSFSQQRGVELTFKNAVLKGCYILTLQAFSNNLIQRPQSKWEVISLMGETVDITCMLLTIGEAPPNKVSFCICIRVVVMNTIFKVIKTRHAPPTGQHTPGFISQYACVC